MRELIEESFEDGFIFVCVFVMESFLLLTEETDMASHLVGGHAGVEWLGSCSMPYLVSSLPEVPDLSFTGTRWISPGSQCSALCWLWGWQWPKHFGGGLGQGAGSFR